MIRLLFVLLYLFFGIMVTTAALCFFDDGVKEIGMFILLFWPLALIVILLILLGYCAFYIGRLIGEWMREKLIDN